MAGSLLVAVRSGVIDGLANETTGIVSTVNTGGALVEIRYAWRLDESVREWVFTSEATFTHDSAAMRSGRNFRDEVGKFNLVVLVAGVDSSQEETSERALVIATACEEWIADRKNNELGISGLQTLTVAGDGRLEEMYADAGHLAIVELPIKYTARLT
jgi:hypothetical protein